MNQAMRHEPGGFTVLSESTDAVANAAATACAALRSKVLESLPDSETIQRSPASKRQLRVLVADDCRDAADSLAMLLEMWGHEVRAAYDGAAALEMVSAYQPDVLLLDIGMPRLDGCRLARRLRGQIWLKDVLLIAVTGWADEAHRRLGEAAGFDLYLVKPVDLSALEVLLALEQDRLMASPAARPMTSRRHGIRRALISEAGSVFHVVGAFQQPLLDSRRERR